MKDISMLSSRLSFSGGTVKMLGRNSGDSLLSNILDSATHTAIIVTDFAGKIIVFNQGATNLFGYTQEEAMGRSLPELTFLKEDQDAHLFEKIVERVRSEGWTEENLSRRHKSGAIFSSISTITCLKNSTVKYQGVLEITQDMPNLFRL
jgi:PAS domain S-box-containing protein